MENDSMTNWYLRFEKICNEKKITIPHGLGMTTYKNYIAENKIGYLFHKRLKMLSKQELIQTITDMCLNKNISFDINNLLKDI